MSDSIGRIGAGSGEVGSRHPSTLRATARVDRKVGVPAFSDSGGGWPLVVVSNGRREGETPAGEPGCSQSRQRRMEPLWSPVVATGGNHRQIERTRKPQKQAKSVATGCHRLPPNFHGK